jgi:hypothetical protein
MRGRRDGRNPSLIETTLQRNGKRLNPSKDDAARPKNAGVDAKNPFLLNGLSQRLQRGAEGMLHENRLNFVRSLANANQKREM